MVGFHGHLSNPRPQLASVSSEAAGSLFSCHSRSVSLAFQRTEVIGSDLHDELWYFHNVYMLITTERVGLDGISAVLMGWEPPYKGSKASNSVM